MSERKLNAWREAGLIDADAVARIRVWEADNSRPLGIWALVGLGALAIGVGIVSVVAANWDAIPGETRLALHFAMMIALSGFIWWRMSDAQCMGDFLHDAFLFIASILGLTFFAHVGQVYQTNAPLWQPLLAWLIMFSPLLLIFGRGWPVAAMWVAGVLGTALAHADEQRATWLFGSYHTPPLAHPILYWGLIACPPILIAAIAAALRERTTRPLFWRLIEKLAVIATLAGLSILIITRGWSTPGDYISGSTAIQSFALALAAAAIFFGRPTRSRQSTAAIFAAAAVIHLTGAVMLHPRGGDPQQWINAILFIMLWCVVAYAALYAGWRRSFQLAIGLIAVRIIILSFELNDDLLGSGLSLIFSGIVAIAVAWATVRISRTYAPRAKDVA